MPYQKCRATKRGLHQVGISRQFKHVELFITINKLLHQVGISRQFKHVELFITINKLLHQVGISRQFHI